MIFLCYLPMSLTVFINDNKIISHRFCIALKPQSQNVTSCTYNIFTSLTSFTLLLTAQCRTLSEKLAFLQMRTSDKELIGLLAYHTLLPRVSVKRQQLVITTNDHKQPQIRPKCMHVYQKASPGNKLWAHIEEKIQHTLNIISRRTQLTS